MKPIDFAQWWDDGAGKPVDVGYDCAKAAWDAQEAQKAELIAALRECVTQPGAHCYSADDRRAYLLRMSAINIVAGAAILKATGEQP